MPDETTTCPCCGGPVRVHTPEHDGATGYYASTADEEISRLREIIRRLRDLSPWPFHGGEPDYGQHEDWFSALRDAKAVLGEEER